MSSSSSSPNSDVPKDLRPISRFITTTAPDGKAIISEMLPSRAPVTQSKEIPVHFSLMYTLSDLPPRLTQDEDLENYTKYLKNAPSLTIPGGVVGRICDYPPGFESPMHRTLSVDLGIVVEGEIELLLDSGERRLLKVGDVAVQRATMHAWKNVTPGSKWARMFYVLMSADVSKTGDVPGPTEDLGNIPKF